MRTVNVTDLSHEMLGAMLDRYWLIKKKKKKNPSKSLMVKSFHERSLSLKSSQKCSESKTVNRKMH